MNATSSRFLKDGVITTVESFLPSSHSLIAGHRHYRDPAQGSHFMEVTENSWSLAAVLDITNSYCPRRHHKLVFPDYPSHTALLNPNPQSASYEEAQ